MNANRYCRCEFMALPGAVSKGKQYDSWKSDLSGWLFHYAKLELWRSPTSNTLSKPGRVGTRFFAYSFNKVGREERDRLSDELRKKYAPKITTLPRPGPARRAGPEKQQNESRSSQVQAVISLSAHRYWVHFWPQDTQRDEHRSRATTAIRSAGRVMKESQEVGHAKKRGHASAAADGPGRPSSKSESDTLMAATDPLTEKLDQISL